MVDYMTQKMQYASFDPIIYYRKQKKHNHSEGTKFSKEARARYAKRHGIEEKLVEAGSYRSNQPKPRDGKAY